MRQIFDSRGVMTELFHANTDLVLKGLVALIDYGVTEKPSGPV